jgi:hypothetical protein
MADIIALIYEDHDWFRRHFFYLDDARTKEELTAIWEPLATRLDTHAQAEEEVFYPVLLKVGDAGDPEDETDDAINDHNSIRDAIRTARECEVGTDEWFEAVGRARSENSEHLAEEEDEGLPDFRKHASAELRTRLGELWLRFYAQHADGRDVRTSDLDPEQYIAENS